MTANIQISAKTPDGRIFVVGGADYAEATANLAAVIGDDADATQAIIDEMATALKGVPVVLAPLGAAPLTPPWEQPQPRQAPQGPAPGGGRVCAHGQMSYKTGVSSRGAWQAYFCPAPKGDPGQCKAQFV